MKNKKSAFTIIEITIAIALIALITAASMTLFNPVTQIHKSWDTKRKHELKIMQKSSEDFYNDKTCYPRPNDICYNSPTQISDNSYTCNICGRNTDSPDFSPYLSQLPCDPQSPKKEYLYQVDDQTCPTWYRIYAKLNNLDDPVIAEIGCQDGCGPIYDKVYSYAVTSPNVKPEGIPPCPGSGIYCLKDLNCNICNPPDDANCLNPTRCDQQEGFFTNTDCNQKCLLPRQ